MDLLNILWWKPSISVVQLNTLINNNNNNNNNMNGGVAL